MSIIKFFYDLETTGVNPRIHSIHQLSGIVEIDNVIVEEFNIHSRPHPKAEIDQGALDACNVTKEQILSYQPMELAHKEFKELLKKYIDPFNKKQKAYLVGFNNRAFDDEFLRRWFKQCKDETIGMWFWTDTLDVLVLASQYLIDRRPDMPTFKLKRVAIELGLIIDKEELHDAKYDSFLTRQIYRIVTGLDLEI